MTKVACSEEFPVEKNPYPNLYLDITKRCNMQCNYCYNPAREDRDMDLSYFREVCQRLPEPVDFRFLGGEPTLHPQLFQFIATAREYGHNVFFASNGIRYNDQSFMEGLKALGGGFCPGLSMDGGTSSEKYYKLLNNRKCLQEKLSAIENLSKYQIKRVAVSSIIIRGVNESVIGEMLELANHYKNTVRSIHFRSVAQIGRWVNTKPYSLTELKNLVRPYFTEHQFAPRCIGEIYCPPEEQRNCCYRFRPTPRVQISLIEFATSKSAACPKRGKLLFEGFIVQPFFENMIEAGTMLEEEYGEISLS